MYIVFFRIFGYSALTNRNGVLVLAETIPQDNQRLYNLLQPAWLSPRILQKLKQAEEFIYQDQDDPMVNWNAIKLKNDLEKTGLVVEIEKEPSRTSILITTKVIEHWFSDSKSTQTRLSYQSHLEKILSTEDVNHVKEVFEKHLRHKTIVWSSVTAYFKIYSN